MQNTPRLEVTPCSVADARGAAERWHYAPRMPVGRLICHGVWEGPRFVGAIIYGRGATPHLGKPYGCDALQVCELVRVALAPGRTLPTSQALSVSLRLLARSNPGLRLVVSFADISQGHVGTLYQATNWVYSGMTAAAHEYFHGGRWCHQREITSGAFGKGGAIRDYSALPKRAAARKHRYLFPLERGLRASLPSQPYPKRATPPDAPVA